SAQHSRRTATTSRRSNSPARAPSMTSEPPLLETPANGIPDVVDTAEELSSSITSLAAGQGPIAVDAERASGIRYGQRAFLVQLRRQGAGTFLLDSETLGDLSGLNPALGSDEWAIHSVTPDPPCSTPSSPPVCSDGTSSVWPRSPNAPWACDWPRSIRPPTGPPAPCPRPGSTTPPSMSRCCCPSAMSSTRSCSTPIGGSSPNR